MSFLTIPSQEGLFVIKPNKSEEETQHRSTECDDEEEEEEDDDTNVHLIPRCSPVPRKRGASIFDETAEYMRIHQALSGVKNVSFADTTGGDLVDVKEFVAFASDDEEDEARWEEEEAKYRKPEREPIYTVQPEFCAATGDVLLQIVRRDKVSVERLTPVENEPLAVSGLIRVLNISFHKAVYIRSTMDNWVTYFDHPAEYVHGSNDGDTDQFSFKLSFAPPYVTHGSRIEFVVRYETSEGDFWANNSSMNYAVTLLVSYDNDTAQTHFDPQEIRSILKPPKPYSMKDDPDSEDELEKDEEAQITVIRPTPVFPTMIKPEIDIEIAVNPSGSSVSANHQLPSVDGSMTTPTVSAGERFPHVPLDSSPRTNPSFVPLTSETVQPTESQFLPRLHCERGDQTPPSGSSSPDLLPVLHQELRPRSNSSQTGGEEILSSEPWCVHPSTTETNQCPTEEDTSTGTPVNNPLREEALVNVSALAGAHDSKKEVELGLSELDAGLAEDSPRSAAPCEGTAPAVLLSPVAEDQHSLGPEGESPTPELTETGSASVDQTILNTAPESVSAWRWDEEEEVSQLLREKLPEAPPLTESVAPAAQSELDVDVNLKPSFVFVIVVVLLSIAVQEPSVLFLVGTLLLLHCF